MSKVIKGLFLVLIASVAFAFTTTEQGPPQPTSAAQQSGGPHEAAAAPLPAARPLRVTVPAIGVDAPLTDLALQDDGHLAAPPETDANLAGWWAHGPSPGTRGTAIIAGHVDIPAGPAVFYNLGALRSGMRITISRADGTTARFTIDSINVYDAADFPDDTVYADTGRPELRLITCGGGFDRARRQYRGNVVVSAHLTR
ncbi:MULTISPECIES: class F sortase [unclassified Streptomyces]|uniref:class F sortase n=1 Tax=unclassified Streptomyces TaxID=2593676 RepID=UPI0021AC2ECF|nr:class F sortase [Streptomyces sp. PsTaAH-137]